MKRFPCIRDTPRTMKIYDSHNKFLAEFKPNGDKINLHDQKNDKVQYTICHKPNAPSTYQLLQDILLVAEVTPSPAVTDHNISIKNPKYGSDLVISFKNKSDFVAKRNGVDVTVFSMTSDTVGYLDIAKGERRNFSFGCVALIVFWCEEATLPAAASGDKSTSIGKHKSFKKSMSGKSEEKVKASSGRSEEKSKEKISSTKKTSAKSTPRTDLSDFSEKSEEKSANTQSGKSESSDSSTKATATDDVSKLKKRKSNPVKSPLRVTTVSSRNIPLRSISATKSPRVTSAIVPSSSRREQSSNSVLNALLKKNQKNPGEEVGKNES